MYIEQLKDEFMENLKDGVIDEGYVYDLIGASMILSKIPETNHIGLVDFIKECDKEFGDCILSSAFDNYISRILPDEVYQVIQSELYPVES